MRAALPLTIAAFAAGIALGDAWPTVADGARSAAVACAALALGLAWRRRARSGAVLALIAAVASGAALMGERVGESLAALAQPRRQAVIEGRVAGIEPNASGARLALERVAWVLPPDARGPRRVQLAQGAGAAPPPLGATLRVLARTRSLRAGAANPGGFDAARALARRGIGASARAVDPLLVQIVEPPPPSATGVLAHVRLAALARLHAAGRGGALLATLALGDASALPERDRRAWAALGIAHLLSVSGLHLALAAAAAWAIARGVLARAASLIARFDVRRLALALATLAAGSYALLAGLGTPALRSLAMLACLAAAVALRRASFGAHALCVAALLVLVAEPAALFAPGAQLSFAATAALVLGARTYAESAQSRVLRGLAATLSTTALATLATAPIAALHFGAAPPLAGIANLAAVPLTGVLLMPAAFVASAAAFAAESSLTSTTIGACAALAEYALDAALALASLAPRFAPQPPHALALALAPAALALGARTRRLALRFGCALAAQAALALAPAPALEPPLPRIVVLDVGHGDATLVQSHGFSMLVDTGGASPDGWDAGARVVVPALAALGVRELDVLALTHADLDHRGGGASVLDTFWCRELWLPHGASREPALAALVASARRRGVRVIERGLGDGPLVSGGVRVTPLWPPRGALALGDNDRSLVLRVELPGLSALLLGDIEAHGEADLLATGARLRVDVLKLAHHGSRSSNTAALLAAVRPRLAIASAPSEGRFGWPHAVVRERVTEAGAQLAWTGRDGALLLSLSGQKICLRRWRGPPRCEPLRAE